MKPLFDGTPEPRKRTDFGDAPISNARYDCKKCPLAEECKFNVNTLNCEIANKRLRKLLAEGEVKTADSENLKAEQEKSVKDFLGSIGVESAGADSDDEDKDDDDDD